MHDRQMRERRAVYVRTHTAPRGYTPRETALIAFCAVLATLLSVAWVSSTESDNRAAAFEDRYHGLQEGILLEYVGEGAPRSAPTLASTAPSRLCAETVAYH